MPERVHTRFEQDEQAPVNKKRKIEYDVPISDPPQIKKSVLKSASNPQKIVDVPKFTSRIATTAEARNEKSRTQSAHVANTTRPRGENARTPNPGGQFREKARSLLPVRQKLPIWHSQEEIRSALRNRDVLLLVGETGSGKSTQVPQFVQTEQWCRPQKTSIVEDGVEKCVAVGGCVAITEPRRVAAITLARRVADEVGTPLGSSSPASTVGYSVRFDNSTSPNTKIKYLTEGMLLQEMLRDPWLRQYSLVVVDEVHERSVNVDLVLGFLRNMVCGDKEGRGGVPIKVVVMSATANLEDLKTFFDAGYNKPAISPHDLSNDASDRGNGSPMVMHEDKDDKEWSGPLSPSKETKETTPTQSSNGDESHENALQRLSNGVNGGTIGTNLNSSIAGMKENLNSKSLVREENTANSQHISICRISGRQYLVKALYIRKPEEDIVDGALRLIFKINYTEPLPGDILVFLTGQETVESLEKLVNQYATGLAKEVPKLLALPLFAALPQAAQQKVFQSAPFRTRRVIIATNIAETSITVPGVRHVIDCGKSKMKQFRSGLGLESLLCKPISKSAAEQRKGRAGRTAPGTCYRLYTEQAYTEMQKDTTPEILRCDIAQAILTMKARGVTDPFAFPLLTPPPAAALAKGHLQLLQLSCLSSTGAITPLGLRVASLPLSAPLGRVLLAAAEPVTDCLAEVIDIIACLSVEAVFLPFNTEEAKEKAETARQTLMRREGDHLTLLATMQAYTAENADRRAWCERHYVSHRAMRGAWDVRKQLRAQARVMGFQLPADELPSEAVGQEQSERVLKAFLKGFGWKTAVLSKDGYRTFVGRHEIAIHPSSVLYSKKVEAIFYDEFVYTTRGFARGCSAVQMDWVVEATR